MGDAAHRTPSLAEFIQSNLERILEEWEAYARTIPAAAGMDTRKLRDHAEQILRAVARDMAQAQTAQQQKAKSEGQGPSEPGDTPAQQHGSVRQIEGFSLNEMVSEYRALRASVIRLWTRDMAGADRDTLDELTRFNEAIDQALTESIGRYSKHLDRSRELFIGIVGHDLRSPVGALMNAAHYLVNSTGLSGRQAEAASIVSRGGVRLRDMISDLLDVTRTRLGETLPLTLAETDLAAICRRAVDEARACHPHATVELTHSADVRGTWDGARLQQMLSNLVENAVRYGAADRPVKVSALGRPDEVVLSVHNEGAPIPEATRHRLFEPLARGEESPVTRGRAGSMGLGLYIVRIIAEAHGGSVDVESTSAKGTTFTARLPRKKAQ